MTYVTAWAALPILRDLSRTLSLSVHSGDLLMLNSKWYVTHSGLRRLAQRRRCVSMNTELAENVSSAITES